MMYDDDDDDDVCQVTNVKPFAKLLTKLLSLKRQEKSNQVKKTLYRLKRFWIFEFFSQRFVFKRYYGST